MKKLLVAGALSLALLAGGCASIAQGLGSIATELGSSTPTQVNTYADALNAAKLVTDAVDLYVNSANPNRATLLQLQKLNDGVHAALNSIGAANREGGSLVYGSFNAALAAFNAYATTQGVSH